MEAPPQRPAPPPKRLSIKITNLGMAPGGGGVFVGTPGPATTSVAMSPAPETPSSTKPKIVLRKPSQSLPATPAEGVPAMGPPPPPPPPPTTNGIGAGPGEVAPAAGVPGARPLAPKPPPLQTKSGRTTKPTEKKRQREESDDEMDDAPLAAAVGAGDGAGARAGAPLPKPRIKLPTGKLPKVTLHGPSKGTKPAKKDHGVDLKTRTPLPTLKVRARKPIPPHPPGEGYDSEAEDRELDPSTEEQFILRMPPGEYCDYLRAAITERRIGIPEKNGGADVSMKFLDDNASASINGASASAGRRAMVVVNGQAFAAVLLDLPTITEGMKTWDKKAMVKSADICQMLLVFKPVANEDEARTTALPGAVEHGHRWPHGITPPMHDARNRRFRKRLSKMEIKNKEAEVERLLEADKNALRTRHEFVDDTATITVEGGESEDGGGEEEEEVEEEAAAAVAQDDGEADADGEADDYFGDAAVAAGQLLQDGEPMDLSAIDLDAAALEAEFMDAVETPVEPTAGATLGAAADEAATGNVATPGTAQTGTPAAQTDGSGPEGEDAEQEDEDEEDDEEDEEDDDEEDDEDGGGDDDDDDDDEKKKHAGVRAEIGKLRKMLAEYEVQLAQSVQPMMRRRLENSVKNTKAEIRLKLSSIGAVDQED